MKKNEIGAKRLKTLKFTDPENPQYTYYARQEGEAIALTHKSKEQKIGTFGVTETLSRDEFRTFMFAMMPKINARKAQQKAQAAKA